MAFLRRRARQQGVHDGHAGAVVFVQRFGGALNLNVHFHALVLDGVLYDASGREGGERSPELAAAQAASIQGRLAFGPRRGQRVTRVGQGSGAPSMQRSGPACAAHDGFSLHAGVCVSGTDREGLERLCRDVARPAIATERLSELPDGRIAYDLRHPWSDGTTRVVFEPQSFLEKLAALIPPPRAHLVTYHGVLAPAAAMRSRIVPGPSAARPNEGGSRSAGARCRRRRYPWAELLKRVFRRAGRRSCSEGEWRKEAAHRDRQTRARVGRLHAHAAPGAVIKGPGRGAGEVSRFLRPCGWIHGVARLRDPATGRRH